MGVAVLNGTFFIRVNTRLLSYRRNENAEEDGTERRGQGRGMERVSRQGNASAVNEQTLIFSRTKTHPLPPPIFHRPRASPYVPELERGEVRRGGGMTRGSAMHTTAIIIARRRKKDGTTTNKQGCRARVV